MHLAIGNREYLVSEDGQITRLPFSFVTYTGGNAVKREIKLKPTLTPYGYMRLCLPSGHQFVHRIVWTAFNGPIPDGFDIDHINGNRSDNNLSNLRLATRIENSLNKQRANKNSASGVRGVYFHKLSGYWRFAVSGKILKSSKDKQSIVDFAQKYHG